MINATPYIVLAGGKGTRLAAAIGGRPKCLAPVGHEEFLMLLLRLLVREGGRHVMLSLGFQSSEVVQWIGTHALPCRVSYVIEPSALGTGGALLFAMASAGVNEALVVNGDTYFDGDFGPLLRPQMVPTNWEFIVGTLNVPDCGRFGAIKSEGGNVRSFVEKGVGGPGAINVGVYRARRSAFAGYVPGDVFSLEEDVFPKLIAREALGAAQLVGGFFDIGVPEDLARFVRYAESHG